MVFFAFRFTVTKKKLTMKMISTEDSIHRTNSMQQTQQAQRSVDINIIITITTMYNHIRASPYHIWNIPVSINHAECHLGFTTWSLDEISMEMKERILPMKIFVNYEN